MNNSSGIPNEEVLAIFAHEMREPLASILLAVQWMNESTRDATAVRELCEIVERQGQYLASMIDETLEVCRGTHKKPTLRTIQVDLQMVIAGAIEATAPLILARKHTLRISLPSHPVSLLADALKLRRVIINLLSNAAKFTEPGGSIWLEVTVHNAAVSIMVRDNGVGISPALLPCIFDLFRQGEQPQQTVIAGLGIGLALVKSLVELHHGSVHAQSSGEGKGSTFTVRLPLTDSGNDEPPSHKGSGCLPCVTPPHDGGFMGDA